MRKMTGISPFEQAHKSVYWDRAAPCPGCGSRRIGKTENYLTAMLCMIRCYDCGRSAQGEGGTPQEAEETALRAWEKQREGQSE